MTVKSNLPKSKWAPKTTPVRTRSAYFSKDLLDWSKQIAALERTAAVRIGTFFQWATKNAKITVFEGKAKTSRSFTVNAIGESFGITFYHKYRTYGLGVINPLLMSSNQPRLVYYITTRYTNRDLEVEVAGKDVTVHHDIREIHDILKQMPEGVRKLKTNQVLLRRERAVTMVNLIMDEARKLCKALSKPKDKPKPVQLELDLGV